MHSGFSSDLINFSPFTKYKMSSKHSWFRTKWVLLISSLFICDMRFGDLLVSIPSNKVPQIQIISAQW